MGFKFIKIFFSVTVFLLFQALAAQELYPDFKIIQQNDQFMIIEWQPGQLQLKELSSGNDVFTLPLSSFGDTDGRPGEPAVLWRKLTLGIPEDGSLQVQILQTEKSMLTAKTLAPIPEVGKDAHGISVEIYNPNPEIYSSNRWLPEQLLRVLPPSRFRDMPVQSLLISAVQFNPETETLILYSKIRFRVNFIGNTNIKRSFRMRGKLDRLYSKMVLNFEQAKQWLVPRPTRLAKSAFLPHGTWYRIAVHEDGWYKITPSTLELAGIDTKNLSTSALQMFNNGGHELSVNVNATNYNPPFTQEIPFLLFDLNDNQLFDGNDYLLFYGKHVNGWFYNPTTKDFSYQMHTYATENYYWLTVSGNNGLRLSEEPLSVQSNPSTATYFIDRFHFEEDQYNILASGPDWYGHRFYGLSGAYTVTFNLPFSNIPGGTAAFAIQLKGGYGSKYSEKEYYTYKFSVSLNNQRILSNKSFARSTLEEYTINTLDPSLLKNGENQVLIQYQGEQEECFAFLDWFELYFPRSFAASNNQLSFYSIDNAQPMRYSVTNLAQSNDYYVFDVTDPINPVVLLANQTPQSGTLTFDLPASDHSRHIWVTSLSSPTITTVAALEPFERKNDLLATSNQADYLIITHQTFLPYAEQIAALRPHLKSKVVTVRDIYMDFNSGVPDPTAIRNFIRYAYNQWQDPSPSYVLLYGDAHYDYRHIILSDTIRVPTMEIYDQSEVDSRATDNYFVDLNYSSNHRFSAISPDLAIGRIPIESTLDAERYYKKITSYEQNAEHDGWQTVLTFVADDNIRPGVTNEWMHQDQTEEMAVLPNLQKFNKRKVYLSMYPSQPGGFGTVKPEANKDLIDYLNQGTLIVNYVGHGSPTQWAHEEVFVMDRDLKRIINPGKLPFLIAATCDFGKFDDPHEPCFTEALIWEEDYGIIGALASSRLVLSYLNARFNKDFYIALFPKNGSSLSLGEAKLLATQPGVNDQKFFLLADPTMHLADPQEEIQILSIKPDTLKALSEVEVTGQVMVQGQPGTDFDGSAMVIVNDASYDSVSTGGKFHLITLPGPVIFKGQVSVKDGLFTGKFIVPKSIRYVNKKTGRITLYAWNDNTGTTALGFNNKLLLTGSVSNIDDRQGPEIDLFFEGQENFTNGDIVGENPILKATLSDDHGINITGEAGHGIRLTIDDLPPSDISGFFTYNENSYTTGSITYPIEGLESGSHILKIIAFDNLNNPNEQETTMQVISEQGLAIEEVVNYPNPFTSSTAFTFQTNRDGADVTIKIYTLSGRLIQELYGTTVKGYNQSITWDGTDRDGDQVANGVYLYKIIIKDSDGKAEKIDKLVILR